MRILVIGGTRFIGRALVLRLLARGHAVGVVNRGQTEDDLPDEVLRIRGDSNTLVASRDEIAAFAPDGVVHNVVWHAGHVAQLLEACAGLNARLAVTSSMDVYRVYGRGHGIEDGDPDHTLQDEDAPLRTVLHPYRAQATDEADFRWSYDKIPAERALLDAPGVDGLILRLPMVIGPRDPQHRLARFARAMRAGRPAIVLETGFAAWTSTYGHVDNVADGMAEAVTRATPHSVYNVGDWVLSLRQLAEHVAAIERWDGRIVTAEREALPETLREDWAVEHWLACDSSRIRDDLAWTAPIGLEDALRAALAWEHAHPGPVPEAEAARWAAEDAFLSGHAPTGD